MKKHELQTTNGTTVQTTTEITTPTTETTTTETTTTTKKRHGTIMSYKQFVNMVRVRFALGLIIGILLAVAIWAIIRFSIPQQVQTVEVEKTVEIIREIPDQKAIDAAVAEALANAEAEYGKQIETLNGTINQKDVYIALLKKENEEKISALKEEHDKAIKELEDKYTEQITLLNDTFETKLANVNIDHQDEIDELSNKYETELTALQASYEEEKAQLLNANAEALANAEAEYEAKLAAIEPITIEKEIFIEKEVEKIIEVSTTQYVLDTEAMEAKAAELAEVLAQQLFTEYVEGLGDIITVEQAQTMAAEQANLAVQEWIAKQPKFILTVKDCVTQETINITISGELGIIITDADLIKIVQQKYPDRQVNRGIKSYAGSTQIGNRYEFNYEFVEGATEITNIYFVLA